MELDKFIRIFENAIDGVEPNTLSAGTKFRKDIEVWDSLAGMTVLAMIDTEYRTSIDIDKFQQAETIEDVYQLVLESIKNN